jgi:hypothetical protein
MSKSLAELELQELQWVPTNQWQRSFDLKDGAGEVVARLKHTSIWNQVAEIEAPGNRWRFEPYGFWKRRIRVRSVGTDEVIAAFTPDTWNMHQGTLHFDDGRVYHWRQSNLWGSKWAWSTDDGDPVLGYHTGGLFSFKGNLSIEPERADSPSFGVLVFLGWYLVLLQRADSATVGAVASV